MKTRILKEERVARFNKQNPNYYITGIKKMSAEEYASRIKYGTKSLYECYANPSQAKQKSYNDILQTYQPIEILSVIGSSHSYSVLLLDENNHLLLITKSNNYLVEFK